MELSLTVALPCAVSVPSLQPPHSIIAITAKMPCAQLMMLLFLLIPNNGLTRSEIEHFAKDIIFASGAKWRCQEAELLKKAEKNVNGKDVEVAHGRRNVGVN
jgi:hypothetical protein